MPKPNTGPRLVFKRPPGNVRSIFYIRWYEGGRRFERSTRTADRAQAEERLAGFIAEAARPTRGAGPGRPDQALIADILYAYGDTHGPTVVDTGRIGACMMALLPFWGHLTVDVITGETCRAYRRHRAAMGIADGTVRRELGCLQAAGNFCVQEGIVTGFPQRLWKPPAPPPRSRWLSRAEAARLMNAARASRKARFHLPLFIMIGLYTAARRSAILGLQWVPNTEGGHVDLEAGVIDFNPIGRPATRKRRARIKIQRRLMTFLRYQRRRTGRYVFEQDGQRIARINRSFATAARRAGLESVTPHTLSHTCVTWLLQRGVSFWDVAGYTGKSEQVLREVYGHHHPDHMEGAVRALEGAGGGLAPRRTYP